MLTETKTFPLPKSRAPFIHPDLADLHLEQRCKQFDPDEERRLGKSER